MKKVSIYSCFKRSSEIAATSCVVVYCVKVLKTKFLGMFEVVFFVASRFWCLPFLHSRTEQFTALLI